MRASVRATLWEKKRGTCTHARVSARPRTHTTAYRVLVALPAAGPALAGAALVLAVWVVQTGLQQGARRGKEGWVGFCSKRGKEGGLQQQLFWSQQPGRSHRLCNNRQRGGLKQG